ncbi:MAG: DNA adenine methylase [Clostridiaceae bacterium]|nr:DNA adenine methylase [Clostridiaceae bacterium]
MESNWRTVRPCRPAAAYIGGKRRLAEQIVQLIERVPHNTYAEPFVGMGGIFLRRRWVPELEVINDLSRDVATFFRILQRHYQQFMDSLRFQIAGRAAFERLMETDPDTLTDLERAARFLYLQSLSYGGKVAGRTFGVDPGGSTRFNIHTLGPRLEEIHERLAGIVIECLPYGDFIARYDRPGTLFYLDPPYYGSEGYYGKSAFSRADFGRLAKIFRDIKGSFMMSINDDPAGEVRTTFADYNIMDVKTVYSVAGGAGIEAPELVITGGAGFSMRPGDLLDF